MNLGNNFRMARGKLSQADIANKLSISVNTLSAYENNRVLPSLEIFKKMCQIFTLSADTLLQIHDVSHTPSNKRDMLDYKLANIRDQLGFTQKEMADLIKVSVSTWSKYETGNRTPPLVRFQHICKNCKVSADYLLGIQNKN